MKVKCLSVKNPISYLIVSGIKDVENRSWTTGYRGTIYIHSSGRKNQHFLYEDDLPDKLNEETEKLVENDDGRITLAEPSEYVQMLRCYVDINLEMWRYYEQHTDDYFKAGCIIGKVDLIDIVENSTSIFAAPYSKHWLLGNAVLFKEPIPNVKGKLGFFEYDLRKEPDGIKLGQ